MPARHHEGLSRAEDMMNAGKYSEALDLVAHFLSKKKLSNDETFYGKLLEGQIRIKLGNLDQAEKTIDDALKSVKAADTSLFYLEALLIIIEIKWRAGKAAEGMELLRQGEELISRYENDIDVATKNAIHRIKGDFYRHSGILHWYKSELDKANDFLKLGLQNYQERNDLRGIARSYNNLGLVQWSKGEFDEAIINYEKALEFQWQLGNKQEIATTLNNLGNVHILKGDLEVAYDYHQKSFKIREELGNYRDLALSLANLGSVYQTRGDLNQALECLFRGLEYFDKTEDRYGIGVCLNNIGSVYLTRGELDAALEYHKKSLEVRQKLDNKQEIALSLLNIGEIEQRKGNLSTANEYYSESLALYQASGNELYIAICLVGLINVALDKEDCDSAGGYLEKLAELNSVTNNRVINQNYRLAQALILKTSKQGRDKFRAQEILDELVKEDTTSHELTVTAMIHLCDLLLFEMKMNDDSELLTRINKITQNLLDIGKRQGSYSLLAKTNILQSKLALVEGDVEKARILLAQAHITAQEKGLRMLARKISHERDLLQSQLEKWENIIRKHPSKQEMVNLTNLDEFLERMIRKTVSVLSKEEKKYIDDDAIRRKYCLEYVDLLKGSNKSERSNFRIGIAQIGVSETGDILTEFYRENGFGLLGIKNEKIEQIKSRVKEMVENAHENGVNVLLFPEMTIDFNHTDIRNELQNLANTYQMYIIPGSYHDEKSRLNLCRVIGPEGILWEQDKHIPAIIHIEGKRFTEGIEVGAYPRRTIVCNTEFGRMAIVICRDFLDMDLRVELKNFDPPIDLVLNPAFTPVTVDFKAAHFDARRSIYAYCCFANVAEYGDSIIYSPEKEREERTIPQKT
ncbi:MAG: tetratricopeptide repeat protein, partial [Candidatus Thorarchaeota archaeon]